MMVNSDRVLQLIPKARIVNIQAWNSHHPPEIVDIFLRADREGRYIDDREAAAIAASDPESREATERAGVLRDRATPIIERARAELLTRFPGITAPGGELYPEERSRACWRDFWHYLRCISYAVAARRRDYISPEGLENLRLLYEELNVPLGAMIGGLENLRVSALEEFPETARGDLVPYFEELITAMRTF